MNLQDIKAINPVYTPTNTDIMFLNSVGGTPYVIDMDKLANLINGYTKGISVLDTTEYASITSYNESDQVSDSVTLTAGAMYWVHAVHDPFLFFTGAMPTRVTIPNGVTKVEITASLGLFAPPATQCDLSILKNGELTYPICGMELITGGNLYTGVLEVVQGDWFELHVSSDVQYTPRRSWIKVRVIERTI